MKDAFPKRARPCEGKFYPNGDFRTVSGRLVIGPLCLKCGALVNQGRCTACNEKQAV